MAIQTRIELPRKFGFLLEPARYKVAHGGRGGAKSWSFARALLIRAVKEPLRVLCARELQLSIRDSVHRLLKDQIRALGYSSLFSVTNHSILGVNGSEFIFTGIQANVEKVRSLEGVDICWVEEAESVSKDSWEVLIPTIRKAGSEIWVSFNPQQATDPTYKRFITDKPPDAKVVEVNWRDNHWLSDELKAEKDYLHRVDPEAAQHVWEGKTRKRSKAEILSGKWCVEAFEPQDDWAGPYQGADWGFAAHPTVLVRCWVKGNPKEHNHELYIEQETYGVGVDNDELPGLFDQIPGARSYTTRADNARPETISHMVRNGYPRMIACTKWPGSVADGIGHLRGYQRIVIHPDCKHTIDEVRLYSYKVDKLSGDVLPVIVDAHNHCIDAIRYALGPLIRVEEKPSVSVI